LGRTNSREEISTRRRLLGEGGRWLRVHGLRSFGNKKQQTLFNSQSRKKNIKRGEKGLREKERQRIWWKAGKGKQPTKKRDGSCLSDRQKTSRTKRGKPHQTAKNKGVTREAENLGENPQTPKEGVSEKEKVSFERLH